MNKIPVIATLGCTTTACFDTKASQGAPRSINAIIGVWEATSYTFVEDEETTIQHFPQSESFEDTVYGVTQDYFSSNRIFLHIRNDNSYFIETSERELTISVGDEVVYDEAYAESDETLAFVTATEKGYDIAFDNTTLSCMLIGDDMNCLFDTKQLDFQMYDGEIPERFTSPSEINLEPTSLEDNGECHDIDISGTGEALVWGSFSNTYGNDITPRCPSEMVTDGSDLAFYWTSQSAGCYQFTTRGSMVEHTLELKNTCEGEPLLCGSGYDGLNIVTEMGAGESAIIVIDGVPTDDFSLYNLSVIPYEGESSGADGEDLASLTGDSVVFGSNENATLQIETECAPLAAALSYLWTAPESGTVEISTIGSDFDTVLQVNSGDCSLGECNDDAGEQRHSLLLLDVISEHQYEIVLGGYHGDTGFFSLNIHYTTE